MFRILCVSVLYGLVAVTTAHAATVTVRSAQQLWQAARETGIRDTRILVQGRIELGGRGLPLPRSNNVVELIGVPDSDGRPPVIDFQMMWDGDWEHNNKPANGIELNCRTAFVRGIKFTGYESKGSVLKFHGSDLLHVQDCVFEDISTRAWPTRTGGPTGTSHDVWYGNAIGGGTSGSHLIVDRCTFRRVATSDVYAHCIYPVGTNPPIASLTVTNCNFEEVGQPIVTTFVHNVRLFRNTYRDLVKVPGARRLDDQGLGIPVWNFWVGPPAKGSMVAMHETFVNAPLRWPIRRPADPARHYFDYNDYSGIVIENDISGAGRWMPRASPEQPGMNWADWQRAGFDTHSKPPAGHPSTAPSTSVTR
jgi:hypothetical protein